MHLIDVLFIIEAMKKVILLFTIVILLPVFCSCENLELEDDVLSTAEPIILTKSQKAVADQGNVFALDLLKACYRDSNDSNLFLSPMGVSMLSYMLANGAEGETYEEIVKTVGMEGFSLSQVNGYYTLLASALPKVDRSVAFSLANSFWAANDLKVRKDFSKALESTFDAEGYSIDFSKKSSLNKVNGWCSDKTSGLIPKMFDQLNPETRLLLINALYFNGAWTKKFLKDNTKTGIFTTSSGQPMSVPFMNMTADLNSYQDDEVALVRLPYGNGAFVMEAIMPAGDFNTFLKGLDVEKLNRWRMAQTHTVQLQFPKFEMTYDTEEQLPAILNSLGMKRAFQLNAEFGKISTEPLYVSNIRQKAYLMVDEEGTAAAAVSIADMRATGYRPSESPLNLVFDHPFLFLIRENSTGAILFIGTKTK